MNLPERLIAIHRSLDEADVAHAFGGAIALAYWTRNPRGTSDIDVNIFAPAESAVEGLGALPRGVRWTEADRGAIERDGQVRLWWDETPIDLFFDYHEIHAEAHRNRQFVPFAGVEIPILGPTELAIFKAMFDRTRDWADLEEMGEAGALDRDKVAAALVEMVGPDDERVVRLARLPGG